MLFIIAQDEFLTDCRARALSEKTTARYRGDLESLRRFLARCDLAHVEQASPEILRAYFDWLHTRPNRAHKKRGLSPFTVEGMYRSVKTFFVFCHVERYIPANPMLTIRRPKLPQKLTPRLTEEQVKQLVGMIARTRSPERNLAYLLLLADSGLRRGEALGLKLGDVDLREGWVKVNGKGNKERIVPLGKTARAAIRAWLTCRVQHNGCEQVFVNCDGSPWQADGVRSLFNRLRKRLGVNRLYPHLLRHTFAKMFLLRSHDAKALQKILGHAKASTTLDLYVDYDLVDLTKIHRRYSPMDALCKQISGGGGWKTKTASRLP